MMVESVHGSWTTGGSVHHGPPTVRTGATGARWHTHWSLASDRSQARKLIGEGQARGGEDDEAGTTLTRAREAA
jgi:hypothetical protein